MNDRVQEAKEARKASRVNGKVADAEWRGYINVSLSEDDKRQFEVWSMEGDPWEVMTEAVRDGVVLTVKLSPGNSGFLASATQRRTDSVNAGLAVTARANEPWKALVRVLFLLARLGVTTSWELVQPVADDDRW